MKQTVLGLWILLAGIGACPALTNLTGNLVSEAQRLENFSRIVFGEGSNNYVAPTSIEWSQFRTLTQSLWDGDTNAADMLAGALGYELFTFTDTNFNTLLLGVRSQETNGAPLKGWGTYFINTNAIVSALIGSPHPQSDLRTPLLAAEVFLKSGARGLMIAGAHRHVNGDSTGDPCDLTNTIFHAVHEQWSSPGASNLAWQIHGFAPANHPGFPVGTLAVLSTGQGGDNFMSTNIVRLDQRLEWNGFKSYAYAKNLATNSVLNLLVNEGVDGQTFTNLAARSNVQGDYSHAAGGSFMHVELATFTRTNAPTRSLVADAIACAVILSATNEILHEAQIQLTNAVLSSGAFSFQLGVEKHRAYRAEFKSALTNQAWQVIRSFPGGVQPITISHTNLPPAQGFFRVVGEGGAAFGN